MLGSRHTRPCMSPSRSSLSSGSPPPARPSSRSTSPSGSAARSSTPTRCRSTAAWTSVRRSCRPPSAAASRTTCSTCSSVREPATVAEFQGWARDVVAQLRGDGTIPVLVGGSALYTRAVLDRFEFPGTDERGPRPLGGRARRRSARAALHARLAEPSTPRPPTGSAPTTAAASSGRSRSSRSPAGRSARPSRTLEYADPHTVQIGLAIDRPTLDARIEQRVEAMFAAGFVGRGRAAARRGAGRGPHRLARDRLPRGDGPPRRRAHPRRGQGAHRHRHPAVRPPPGLVVPQGPADRLDPVRRPRAGASEREAVVRKIGRARPPSDRVRLDP